MHTGGVNVALGDASVRFVSDTVNSGNATTGNLPAYGSSVMSPFGIWGAYGTRNCGESTSL